eukprot:1162142-Pelagomonas_calceolata.AAC.3
MITSCAGHKVAWYLGCGGPWLLRWYFGVLSMEILRHSRILEISRKPSLPAWEQSLSRGAPQG